MGHDWAGAFLVGGAPFVSSQETSLQISPWIIAHHPKSRESPTHIKHHLQFLQSLEKNANHESNLHRSVDPPGQWHPPAHLQVLCKVLRMRLLRDLWSYPTSLVLGPCPCERNDSIYIYIYISYASCKCLNMYVYIDSSVKRHGI